MSSEEPRLVLPVDLGLEVQGGRFAVIFEAGGSVPLAASRVFAVADPKRNLMRLRMLTAEPSQPWERKLLGELLVRGFGSEQGEARVEISFRIDGLGNVWVHGRDLGDERVVRLQICGVPREDCPSEGFERVIIGRLPLLTNPAHQDSWSEED